MNISNAQAAAGIYFKPEHFGLLYVQSSVVINELYGYNAFWAGCNVRGWAGFLVQGYDALFAGGDAGLPAIHSL